MSRADPVSPVPRDSARTARPDRATLDAALLAAHARRDAHTLIGLYTEAADMAEADGDIDAACFFLTQAYVYALERGAPDAEALHARLAARGREE